MSAALISGTAASSDSIVHIARAQDPSAPPEPSATLGMQQFEQLTFDATNYLEATFGCVFSLGIVGWTTRTLRLEEDEAVLITKNRCVSSIQKRPYAQLGAVDSENTCRCCWSVKTDLTGEAQGAPGLARGWGCDEAWTKDVIGELQARKVGRGNIAQLRAQEVLATRVDHLHAKVDLILAHMHIGAPPPPAVGYAAPTANKVVRQ